jgi:hypothetical protein
MRLPTITIDGREWFIDGRLKELRAVDNPHERITEAEWTQRYYSGQVKLTGKNTYATKKQTISIVLELGIGTWRKG